MTAFDPDLEEVHVREHPLPGTARFFESSTSDGRVLEVFTESDPSNSHLAVPPPGADAPVVDVRLGRAQAITLSPLLSGMTVVVHPIEGDVERGCQVGDRLVLVGRPDPLASRVRHLQG